MCHPSELEHLVCKLLALVRYIYRIPKVCSNVCAGEEQITACVSILLNNLAKTLREDLIFYRMIAKAHLGLGLLAHNEIYCKIAIQ